MALQSYTGDLAVSEKLNSALSIIYNSIKDWWNGKITGKRCAKNVMDAGAIYGVGAFAGALGTYVGGTPGGFVGSTGGSALVNLGASYLEDFTCWLFDLPRTEALDKAYEFFGVRHDVEDKIIKKKWNSLLLKHHPDKGGDTDKFLELQIYYALIKKAR